MMRFGWLVLLCLSIAAPSAAAQSNRPLFVSIALFADSGFNSILGIDVPLNIANSFYVLGDRLYIAGFKGNAGGEGNFGQRLCWKDAMGNHCVTVKKTPTWLLGANGRCVEKLWRESTLRRDAYDECSKILV